MSLILTRIIDGPLSGGIPKAIEFFVTADIADLSVYGLGSANNGGGSDGEEFTFDAVSATAGDYIYVASESTGFTSFFGFAPDYTDSAANVNGDDAIELFENGTVIDTFGDINTDGSGEPWEYLDGWAARADNTGPDAAFNIANWTFSGPNALDGSSDNATAATPVTIGTFVAPLAAAPAPIVITGVFDGPLSGGVPKAIELYVQSDITDLSIFGLGSANNGGGTDGQEFTFPAGSATAGTYLYIATETDGFTSYFGFAPDFTSGVASINGDDAIELFQNGEVIDVFGDIDVDGSGELWDYLDGWAYRNAGAEAGTSFELGDWTFSGTNANDGETANGAAANPFPLGTFGGDGNGGGGTDPVSIVINEIHADPAGDITGDANGDGTRDSSDDEFVEIVNTGDSDADLSGFTLSDAVAVRHTFPEGTVIPAGGVLVIFGGDTPTGTFNGALVQTASAGFLGLNNSGDTITIVDADGNTVADAVYGSEGGNNQSLTRDPSETGEFVAHSTADGSEGALYSPGVLLESDGNGGGGGEEPQLVKIHEIQGDQSAATQAGIDDKSALENVLVSVTAVVTADFQDGVLGAQGDLNGFYLQEEDADTDGNPYTSEGIFVFDNNLASAVDVMVGDLVSVTGTVDEFFGETQIAATNIQVLSDEVAMPTPVDVTFPVASAYLDDDGNYVANLEAYEGMRLNIAQDMVITEMFNLDRFGEIRIADERLEQFTQNNDPDVAGFAQHQQDIARAAIVVDDGQSVQNPDSIFALDGGNGLLDAADAYGMGDTLGNLSGVLTYAFDEFRLHVPTGDYTDANPRQAAPEDVGGNFKVASLNVLNFFTTLDDGTAVTDSGLEPRGADDLTRFESNSEIANTDPNAEFDRQLEKLVNTLVAMDADIVGLVEIENDNDDEAKQSLVDAVNAALGSEVYSFVSTGLVGGDAIQNGFIYKLDTVNLAGDVAILEEHNGIDFQDPLSAGRPLNRPAVTQTFEHAESGETLTIAVNHLKSKGSLSGLAADEAQGNGSGNNDATREAAAELLADWLATDPTGQGSENVLILGDLNAYGKEAPVVALEDAGFIDLAEQFIGESAYSFVFDGQIGTLDYAMSNAALLEDVTGVTEWHINSDEPDAFDYNLDFGRSDALFDGNSPHRNSDHDPVIVGFNFAPAMPVYEALGDMVFDGTNSSVIELPHDAAYETDAGTIAFTFAADDLNGRQGLFSKDAAGFVGGGGHTAIWLEGDTLRVRLQSADDQVILDVPGIEVGSAYDIGLTFGPDGAALYVNSAIAATSDFLMDWTNNTQAIQWGALGWASGDGATGFQLPFDGVISDKRIFDQELDAEAIDELFDDGGPVYESLGDMVFDGSNSSVVELPHEAAYETNAGTIAFTFEAEDLSGRQGLFSKDAAGFAGGGNHTAIWLEGDALQVRLQSAVDQVVLEVPGIEAGTDYDIGLTFGPNGAALYVNGAVAAVTDFVMDWTENSQAIQWGGLGWASGDGATGFQFPFAGVISDKRIFDQKLDAEAIETLFDESLPSPVFTQPGVETYDGTTASIDEYAPDPDLQLAEGTIAFAFQADDTAGVQGLVSRDAAGFAGGGDHISIWLENDLLNFRFQDGNASEILSVGGISADSVYEVAATFGPNGVSAWLGGALVGQSTTVVPDLSDSEQYLQAGGLGWTSAAGQAAALLPLEGAIADLEIYDEVLDAADIGLLASSSSFDMV